MRAVMDSDRFLGMQPHQLAPMITTITTDLTREDRAVTSACRFRLHACILVKYIWSFFSQERGLTFLILKAHMYTITLAAPCAISSITREVSLF